MERSNDAKSGDCRTSAIPDNSWSHESYWNIVFDATMSSLKSEIKENQPFRGVVDADRVKGAAYEMAISGVGNFFVI